MTDATSSRDEEIAALLRTLPAAPQHDPDFWGRLDRELDAAATPSLRRRRFTGRSPFLLAAAVLLAVLGSVGYGLSSRLTPQSIEAGDPTEEEAAADDDARGGDGDAVDGERPSAADGAPPADGGGEPDPGTTAEDDDRRITSELFRYDLILPDELELVSNDGSGIIANFDDPEDPFTVSLTTVNYRAPEEVTYFEGYTTLATESVSVPLFERADDGAVTETTVRLDVEQRRVEIGDQTGIARTYVFDDRTIVIEVRWSLPDQLDADALFGSIRMFDEPVGVIETCSTDGIEQLAPPQALNQAQRATFSAVMAALSTCDWDGLEAQMGPNFEASLGGGDAIELWQEAESDGVPALRSLYDILGTTSKTTDDGSTNWPSASVKQWADVTADEREELVRIGDEESFETYADIGYFGYRTAIGEDGTWLYFVAGD